MRIAIAGCGIAGATTAFLLAEHGFDVTVFEQAEQCGPIGAGILLQPSGQRVLRSLGMLDTVAKDSARIDQLNAVHRSGRRLARIRYDRVSDQLFGLGVHRGLLFSLLFDRCLKSGADVRNGCHVHSYDQHETTVELRDDKGQSVGRFDMVIGADGSNSQLRRASALKTRTREYDFAALWTTGPCVAVQRELLQIVGGTTRLIGLLPIGNNRCSLFWGLRCDERAGVWEKGLEQWKKDCIAFSPAAEEVVSSIRSLDDVTYATYRNVRMSRAVDGRVALIGDAAHATSPHLGQGVNLALVDAVCLSNELKTREPEDALRAYDRNRRSTTRFYATLTGWLTPYFQSDSAIRGWGRDLCLPWMPGLPYVGRQMSITMAGLKTGWFTDSLHAEEGAVDRATY